MTARMLLYEEGCRRRMGQTVRRTAAVLLVLVGVSSAFSPASLAWRGTATVAAGRNGAPWGMAGAGAGSSRRACDGAVRGAGSSRQQQQQQAVAALWALPPMGMDTAEGTQRFRK